MTNQELDAVVQEAMARRLYLSYCEMRGAKPWKNTPHWAKEYAVIAVDFLGYDDDLPDRLKQEANA